MIIHTLHQHLQTQYPNHHTTINTAVKPHYISIGYREGMVASVWLPIRHPGMVCITSLPTSPETDILLPLSSPNLLEALTQGVHKHLTDPMTIAQAITRHLINKYHIKAVTHTDPMGILINAWVPGMCHWINIEFHQEHIHLSLQSKLRHPTIDDPIKIPLADPTLYQQLDNAIKEFLSDIPQ